MANLFGHVPRDESRAALVALLAGAALMSLKFVAYFLTGSAVIFSDAVESIVNVAAAAFALYSIVIAHRPADASHPYGHGKVEFISAGFEGGMILVAAIVSAVKATDDLIRRRDLSDGRLDWGLALMALALLVNGAMGFWLVRTGRRQGSLTLEADGHHLLTDALTSVVAIVALGVVRLTGWRWADPVAALLVAAYISRTGVRLLGHAVGGLMDRQDVEDEALLRRILDSHVGAGGKDPRICGYHKLRHRHSGRYHWVDFHITVPADWNIDRGHKVASAIEYEIEQALGEGNATAHVEPCTEVACGSCGEKEVEPRSHEAHEEDKGRANVV
jgi:cation diffusion facilitator family transporter